MTALPPLFGIDAAPDPIGLFAIASYLFFLVLVGLFVLAMVILSVVLILRYVGKKNQTQPPDYPTATPMNGASNQPGAPPNNPPGSSPFS
jgi:hypothetical protein